LPVPKPAENLAAMTILMLMKIAGSKKGTMSTGIRHLKQVAPRVSLIY
jgi:hypothetical protein